MCKSAKFVEYLLLHCEIATAFWSAIVNRVGLARVMPKRVVDLFCLFERLGGSL
jgi:hypothetical protein